MSKLHGPEACRLSGAAFLRLVRLGLRTGDRTYCTEKSAFVTCLANAGVHAALVQHLAGHNATTTVKHCTGAMREALWAAQARLPFGEALQDVSNADRGPGGRSGRASQPQP